MSLLETLYAATLALIPVSAEAEVTVSNGRHFTAIMRYAGPNDAEYIRRRPGEDNRYVIAPDGVSLTSPKGREPLDPSMMAWILSHQFHAQMLDFAALNDGFTRRAYAGCECDELVGNRVAPALGITHLSLVVDRAGGHARMLLVHRRDAAPVVSTYSDWRETGGRSLPFAVDIDDGKDRYAFRFTHIAIG